MTGEIHAIADGGTPRRTFANEKQRWDEPAAGLTQSYQTAVAGAMIAAKRREKR